MKKIIVRCTLEIPVEVPDDEDYDMFFDIEENHCPGTGLVGAALKRHIEDCEEKNVCWGCPGSNEIL
jgi:hypothetical protein